MKYINKSKPIKFSLLVGGRECRSVEDVKQNFNFNSLWDNFCNGSLKKWLRQIGESSLLNCIDEFSSQDLLPGKVRLYNLFSPDPLPSDEVNDGNVLKLFSERCLEFGELRGTPFANNFEIKKSLIHNIDNDTLNSWCESDLEMLKYVYSKKSYDNLNATNCRRLIDEKVVMSDEIFAMWEKRMIDDATFNQLCENDLCLLKKCNVKNLFAHLNAKNSRRLIDESIITNEDVISEIATKHNLIEILERCKPNSKLVKFGGITIEMILVKDDFGGDFYIGKYPVTQAQWKAVMGNNPSFFKEENHPVERVSWNNCQDFIKVLNSKTGCKFRLPKEKEWEYAARGGKNNNNYTYSGSNDLDEVAWYFGNSNVFYLGGQKYYTRGTTYPVGQKKCNELGIYDMSGNVWEYCEDFYSSSLVGRVIRGGSWCNGAPECTVNFRGNCYDTDRGESNFGLRLVMDA